MKQYGTEQEKFWAGEFGDEYISRNDSAAVWNKRKSLNESIRVRIDKTIRGIKRMDNFMGNKLVIFHIVIIVVLFVSCGCNESPIHIDLSCPLSNTGFGTYRFGVTATEVIGKSVVSSLIKFLRHFLMKETSLSM